jgi:hypothetical protein
MRFPLRNMSVTRVKNIGKHIHYQGHDYTIAWSGVLTGRRNITKDNVTILKLAETSGNSTSDFFFCTVRRFKNKLIATKLPSGGKNPFRDTNFSRVELKDNISVVNVPHIHFNAKLPCYPLSCFVRGKSAIRSRQAFPLKKSIPQFKGWYENREIPLHVSREDIIHEGLCAVLSYPIRTVGKESLFPSALEHCE